MIFLAQQRFCQLEPVRINWIGIEEGVKVIVVKEEGSADVHGILVQLVTGLELGLFLCFVFG